MLRVYAHLSVTVVSALSFFPAHAEQTISAYFERKLLIAEIQEELKRKSCEKAHITKPSLDVYTICPKPSAKDSAHRLQVVQFCIHDVALDHDILSRWNAWVLRCNAQKQGAYEKKLKAGIPEPESPSPPKAPQKKKR